MSIYPNVTREDLTNLRKLAEKQKNQRARKIKNRISKQTHDIKLAENLPLITKIFKEGNETTKTSGETVKKSDVEDENTQTPAIQNIKGTQSLRGTLTLKKRKNFFKKPETENGDVFWNKTVIKPLGENKSSTIDEGYNIYPTIQAYFTNTKLTARHMDDEDKLTVSNVVEKRRILPYDTE